MLFFAFAMHKWINLQEPFGAYIINCDELLSSNLLRRWKFSLSSQAADSCLSEQSAYSQGPLSCLSESKQPFNTLLSPWLNSRVISASWNHSLSKQSSPQRWWICVHPPRSYFRRKYATERNAAWATTAGKMKLRISSVDAWARREMWFAPTTMQLLWLMLIASPG